MHFDMDFHTSLGASVTITVAVVLTADGTDLEYPTIVSGRVNGFEVDEECLRATMTWRDWKRMRDDIFTKSIRLIEESVCNGQII